MSVFGDMTEALFGSVVAEDATYTPPGGSAQAVRVVPAVDEDIGSFGQSRVQSSRGLFDIAVSDLASPVKGGVITHAGTDYTIKAFRHRDPSALIWFIEAPPG